jgi:hypothetical protein
VLPATPVRMSANVMLREFFARDSRGRYSSVREPDLLYDDGGAGVPKKRS